MKLQDLCYKTIKIYAINLHYKHIYVHMHLYPYIRKNSVILCKKRQLRRWAYLPNLLGRERERERIKNEKKTGLSKYKRAELPFFYIYTLKGLRRMI